MAIVDKKDLKREVQFHIGLREGDAGDYVLLPGDPGRVDRVVQFLENCQETAYMREFRTVTGIGQASMRNEGTSRFYAPPEFPAVADLTVTAALIEAAKKLKADKGTNFHFGIVASDDSFYRETPEHIQKLHDLRILSVEMECSAIFIACSQRPGLRGAMISTVAGNLYTGGDDYAEERVNVEESIDDEILIALEAIRALDSQA